MKLLKTMLCLFAALFCAVSVGAEGLDGLFAKIHSPEELERYYADNDFEQILKIPDIYQLPEETLLSKSGDCDDYARLTEAVLKNLGIYSEIVFIKFKGLKIEHAICVWREGRHYNYFDNLRIVRTRLTSIQDIIEHYYSDFECCTSCDPRLNMEWGTCERD